MRRDIDLIRSILLAVEAAEAGTQLRNTSIQVADKDPVAISDHIQLLAKAGLLEATISKVIGDYGPRQCIIRAITWDGYEYLDSIRDPQIWSKTKRSLAKVGGTASVEIVKALAEHFIKIAIGIT